MDVRGRPFDELRLGCMTTPAPIRFKSTSRRSGTSRLLTAAEECTLAEAIARGDKDARTRMIQANLRLVVKIARDYVGRGMILEDLIGEGNLGLIRATEEFEPRFGTRFSTYAGYWIKQSIRHALINTDLHDSLARPHGRALDQMAADRAARSAANWAACPAFNEVAIDAWSLPRPRSHWWPRPCRLASSSWKVRSRRGPAGGRPWGLPEHAAVARRTSGAGDEWDILASRMERLDAASERSWCCGMGWKANRR